MRNFLKVGEFDPTAILVALSTKPEWWNTDMVRTAHEASPHHAVDDILLRFNTVTDIAAVVNDVDCHPQPAWAELPQVRPLLFDVMRRVEAVRLGRVIITRLPPGKSIPAHIDQGAPVTLYTRFQLVLQCLPGCVFRIEDERVAMKGGEVWRIANDLEHEVINGSADDRIVIIADMELG